MHLKSLLIEGGHSLVIENAQGTFTYNGRGVSDLYSIYTQKPEMLVGASIADKAIGAGAAALMVLGHVKKVHALIISEKALRILFGGGVEVSYDKFVPNIINRAHTGICPLEARLWQYTTANAMLPAIHDFIKSLQ